MKSSQEILYQHAGDMLGLEKHVLEVLDWQVFDRRFRKFPEAFEFIHKVQKILTAHVQLLEEYIGTLNVEKGPSAFKKAVTKITGMSTGVYNLMRREDSTMRNLRDDYTALNLMAISYTMLYTAALAHHDTQLENLSLTNLKETTPLIMEASRIIPSVVAKELSVEGKAADESIIQQALENTQKAWVPEEAGKY